MSAIAAKPAGNAGAFQPVASVIAIILAIIFIRVSQPVSQCLRPVQVSQDCSEEHGQQV